MDFTTVFNEVPRYIQSNVGRMANTTAVFDSVLAEGKIVDFFHLKEGMRIIHDNIRYWFPRQDLVLDLLSNVAAEFGRRMLDPVINGAV